MMDTLRSESNLNANGKMNNVKMDEEYFRARF